MRRVFELITQRFLCRDGRFLTCYEAFLRTMPGIPHLCGLLRGANVKKQPSVRFNCFTSLKKTDQIQEAQMNFVRTLAKV